MYNNVYQEYINNMIGTVPRNQMEFQSAPFISNNLQNSSNIELENLYPELYKVLYPMIQTACMKNTKPITKDTIDEMVNDIYSNFNDDNTTLLNINLLNYVGNNSTNVTTEKNSNNKTVVKNQSENRNMKDGENRQSRRPNNYLLNDLIRILLIRELLGRPGNFPSPNRPGFPPPRPPFRPRDIQSMDYSIYEDPINMYPNNGFRL